MAVSDGMLKSTCLVKMAQPQVSCGIMHIHGWLLDSVGRESENLVVHMAEGHG